MVCAFFGKAKDSRDVFDRLAISEAEGYLQHLNKHEVIYLDCSEVPKGCCDYRSYISRIEEGICRDLAENYPELELN